MLLLKWLKKATASKAKLLGIKVTKFVYDKMTEEKTVSICDAIDLVKIICMDIGVTLEVDIGELKIKLIEVGDDPDNWYEQKNKR